MRSIYILSVTVLVAACGSPEDEGRALTSLINSPGVQGDTTPNQLVTTAMTATFSRTSDCVMVDDGCGVYVFPDTYSSAQTVTAKIRLYWDSAAWTNLNPPIQFMDDLSYNCRFQTCTGTKEICVDQSLLQNPLMPGTSTPYWVSGTQNATSISRPPTTTPPATMSRPLMLEIDATVQANASYRIYCNYHRLLDSVELTRPRILESSRQGQ